MCGAERSLGWGLAPRLWRDFRREFTPFLLYDLYVKIIGAALLAPLASWAVAALLAATGRLSLSNAEIFSFAISPLGLTAILVSATVTLGLAFADQLGLIALAARAMAGERASVLEAIRLTARKLPSLLGLGALQAVFYGLALAPFLAAAGLAYLLLPLRYDVNYLITVRPPVFWVALVVVVIVLVGAAIAVAALYLRWIFSVPALLFEGAGPVAALRRSARMMRGNWRRVAAVLLAWAIVMVIAPLLVTTLFDLVAGTLLRKLVGDLDALITGVALLAALYVLAIEAVTLIGLSVNGILITHLYMRLGGGRGESAALLARETRELAKVRAARRRYRWLPAAGVLLVLAAAVFVSLSAIRRIGLGTNVQVTAHRGSSARAPENTLSAIEAAIEDGADYAEIDVQETADGEIVLLHDKDLMRVAGVERHIWEITLGELRRLDAGSWFAPRFAGERVPTLGEAIAVARDRIKLNIELKFNGHDELLAERVVRILEDEDFVSQAAISSLELRGLRRVRALNPSILTGYMIYRAEGDVARLDVDFLSFNRRLVDRNSVTAIHAAGKELHVWTVDDRQQMWALVDLGVDNITTNVQAALRAVVEERAALGEGERVLLAFANWLRR